MNLLAAYLLRQKTRPTEEEAHQLIATNLLLHHSKEAVQTLSREADSSLLRVCISNVTQDRPVDELIEHYIRHSGGGRYLDHPASFEVVTHAFDSGSPPEPTRLALVFARSVEEMKGTTALPSVYEPFVERGARWEALGHFGDAAVCYAVGLRLCGVHPELNLRLGRALMRFPRELGIALRALEQAAEALPGRADVQATLGRCLVAIADNKDVEIQGATHDDLRRMGVARLESAVRLAPDDTDLGAELATQRRLTGKPQEDSFYD